MTSCDDRNALTKITIKSYIIKTQGEWIAELTMKLEELQKEVLWLVYPLQLTFDLR